MWYGQRTELSAIARWLRYSEDDSFNVRHFLATDLPLLIRKTTPMAYQKKLDAMKMCIQCAHDCTLCAHDCLHMGGEHATPSHQAMMIDCAEICTLVAHFLGRHSPNAAAMCNECVIICERCAAGCDKLAHGEGHNVMKQCAQTCRLCAAACEAMAEVGVEGGAVAV